MSWNIRCISTWKDATNFIKINVFIDQMQNGGKQQTVCSGVRGA